MVVYVVHTRDRRGWRGGDASAMNSRNLVRLASRSVAATAPAIPSSSSGGAFSLSRAGGRPLRATSPPPSASIRSRPLRATSPPPASIGSRPLRATSPAPPASTRSRPLRATSPPPSARIPSVACLESRTLRSDDEDWEEVVVATGDTNAPDALQEATEEQGVVFCVPPTDGEVRAAVASMKRVFEKARAVDSETPDLKALALPISVRTSSGLFVNHFAFDSDASKVELDELTEPATLVLNSSALLHQSVLDAFRLLHEDNSVQKMVMGITTDKVVWDAVMNNDAVQEFKRSFQKAKETDLKGSSAKKTNFKGSSTAPLGLITWVLENTKAKIKEFVEKILGLLNMFFQAGDKGYDFSDDIVRMSFMLSVFVFIVVTIARIR